MDKKHNNTVFLSKNDQKSALFNRRSIRRFDVAQYKKAQDRQDKFFVFSLTIATILYKYMHTSLCAAGW